MKKICYKSILAILIIACGIILYTNLKWKPVKWGINIFSAYSEVRTGNSIIVHRDKMGYYYKDGLFSKEYLLLIGKSPWFQFPSETLDNNIFLLRGGFREDLRGYSNKTVYEVDEWDIIIPIRRSYNLAYQNGRLTRPIFFIDEFDIQNGDFEIVNNEHTISRLEAKYLNDTDSEWHQIVTYENIDGNIIWHLVKNYGEESVIVEKNPIELKGSDLPHQVLKTEIFVNGERPFEYANYFLIIGERQENQILVSDWNIIVPFESKLNNVQNYYLDVTIQTPLIENEIGAS